MIALTISGTNYWLTPWGPNTGSSMRIGAKIKVNTLRRLTGRTSRRVTDRSLRLSLEWSVVMTPEQFAQARNASQQAQDERILCPLWLFARRAAVAIPVSSAFTLAWTADWTTVAVNPGSLAGFDFHAPLLVGHFTQSPRLGGKNGLHVSADFYFEEDSTVEQSLTPPAAVDATFATSAGTGAPIFPFVHEGGKAPAPGLAVTSVDRKSIGPGRIKNSVFVPQTPERVDQQSFKMDSDGVAQLLGWWKRRGGVAEAHWVATTQQIGVMATDLPAGGASFTFVSAPLNGPNADISLSSPGKVEIARLNTLIGLDATLGGPVASSWPARYTNVCLAMLARHTNEELVIECRRADGDWVCESTLTWRETASEYDPPPGENNGVTQGRLPDAVYCYQIDLDFNGAIQTWRLTNFMSGVTVGGYTWAYNDCDLSEITFSDDLEDDGGTFNATHFSPGPWDNWLPGKLGAKGFITWYRADMAVDGTLSNFQTLWSGELGKPTTELGRISQEVLGANARFSRKVPKQVISPSCDTQVFLPRCGLNEADWFFNATITAIAGNSVTVGTISRSNGTGNPAGFGATNWFALGYLQWSALDTLAGTYTLTRRAGISSSSALGGGTITVTLDLTQNLTVGQAVKLRPGCDRLGDTCRNKFGNYPNHRGFEFTPAVSPGFIIPQKKATPAKK